MLKQIATRNPKQRRPPGFRGKKNVNITPLDIGNPVGGAIQDIRTGQANLAGKLSKKKKKYQASRVWPFTPPYGSRPR